MEFDILYAIQGLHGEVLDHIILFVNSLAGKSGIIWLCTGILLCVHKRTRLCGFALLLSLLLYFIFGKNLLKDIVERPRPCHIDRTVELLIKRPKGFSFPSAHSGLAFAAAMSVFMHYRKAGMVLFPFAALIAFCRLYLFVHFPTDVLCGALLGCCFGFLATRLVHYAAMRWHRMRGVDNG